MKKVLYLVLENSPKAVETLEELKKEGFNATVVSTESLRHALDESPEDHHFFGLRNLEQEVTTSSLCLFIVEESQLATIIKVIKERTNYFKDIKGFMYSQSVDNYEGSI